mmetsp:Transcript_32715/g.93968  ORF Transcript_32715/g.93968 Transcript_32715/m.93968 type:complete len:219 (-) Transcript_32715:778-1434(-)
MESGPFAAAPVSNSDFTKCTERSTTGRGRGSRFSDVPKLIRRLTGRRLPLADSFCPRQSLSAGMVLAAASGSAASGNFASPAAARQPAPSASPRRLGNDHGGAAARPGRERHCASEARRGSSQTSRRPERSSRSSASRSETLLGNVMFSVRPSHFMKRKPASCSEDCSSNISNLGLRTSVRCITSQIVMPVLHTSRLGATCMGWSELCVRNRANSGAQ